MRSHLLQRFLLLGSVLCPAITAVRADTISAFNFNATFMNGATGTGLVNIDVTTGVVTTLNIAVMRTGEPTYNFTGNSIQGTTPGGYYTTGFDLHDEAVLLSFPQPSLVGYTGGQLCSTSMACTTGGYADSLYGTDADGNVYASSAALMPNTPVSTPEIDPSLGYGSIVMLAGMTAVLRGRKRG